MNVMKVVRQVACLIALSVVGLVVVLANNAKAANYYFDVNGTTAGSGVTNGSTYSWEDPNWNLLAAGTDPTINYVDDNFPRFAAATDAVGSYTVTANANHTTLGMILEDGAAGTTLTLNGTGTIGITGPGSGAQQGFIVRGGSNLKIFNTISGTGANGISFSTSGGTGLGSLFLYGNNTYQGGTIVVTGGGLNFNNDNSFGTGTITLAGAVGLTQYVLADPDATAPINIGNAVITKTTASTIVVTGAFPVTFSGTWALAPSAITTLQIGNTSFPNSVTTISGVMSGASASITKSQTGTLVLSGANTYDGTTTINAGSLKLGAPNTIASSTSLVLAGGILNPGGFNHTMTATTVGQTVASTIDYVAGASELDFANSSSVIWNGNLNLANWNPLIDKLRFGTDVTGLTTTQLSQILFNGAGLGTAQISSAGYVSAAIAGDYNQNGIVGTEDYVVWRQNVGQPAGTLPNDTTGLTIGDDQYTLWRSNFGNPPPSSGSGLVREWCGP